MPKRSADSKVNPQRTTVTVARSGHVEVAIGSDEMPEPTRTKTGSESLKKRVGSNDPSPSKTASDRLKKSRSIFKRLLKFDRSHRFHPETNDPLVSLIGTDEVGRGCLAGPVVAAAVILPDLKAGAGVARSLTELNDSKKLSFLQREKLALILKDMCMWAVGEASPSEINDINILQASLLAMRRAVDKLAALTDLSQLPVLVLIDGNKAIKDLQFEQKPVVDGDAKSASIAAASIIAKVHRDRFMIELSDFFPAFNWHQNKGYGSAIHRQALREHGMTEWHRTLFCQRHLVEQLTLDSLLNGSEPQLSESQLNEDELDEDAMDDLCDA